MKDFPHLIVRALDIIEGNLREDVSKGFYAVHGRTRSRDDWAARGCYPFRDVAGNCLKPDIVWVAEECRFQLVING